MGYSDFKGIEIAQKSPDGGSASRTERELALMRWNGSTPPCACVIRELKFPD
jgi:hypothetical protein